MDPGEPRRSHRAIPGSALPPGDEDHGRRHPRRVLGPPGSFDATVRRFREHHRPNSHFVSAPESWNEPRQGSRSRAPDTPVSRTRRQPDRVTPGHPPRDSSGAGLQMGVRPACLDADGRLPDGECLRRRAHQRHCAALHGDDPAACSHRIRCRRQGAGRATRHVPVPVSVETGLRRARPALSRGSREPTRRSKALLRGLRSAGLSECRGAGRLGVRHAGRLCADHLDGPRGSGRTAPFDRGETDALRGHASRLLFRASGRCVVGSDGRPAPGMARHPDSLRCHQVVSARADRDRALRLAQRDSRGSEDEDRCPGGVDRGLRDDRHHGLSRGARRGRELRRGHPRALPDSSESSAPAHALQPHATRLRARLDPARATDRPRLQRRARSRFWSSPRRSAASLSHVATTYSRVERTARRGTT